jgi:hypothetical protein
VLGIAITVALIRKLKRKIDNCLVGLVNDAEILPSNINIRFRLDK